MDKYQETLKKQIKYAEFTENSVVCLDIEVAKGLLTQPKSPTLEEVKREWEAIGYECYSSNYGKHLVLMKNVKMDKYNGDYIKIISINSITKTYSCYIDESYSFDEITLQEHQLLTKTFKALGWL